MILHLAPARSLVVAALTGLVLPLARASPGSAAVGPPSGLPGSPDSVLIDSVSLARVHRYLDSLATRRQFAGTVLIQRAGRPVFERSYGEASLELHTPLTNSARYRLHSITKQFTATAALVLVERGRLALDAPLRRYLPELPEAWGGATIRQVLTHTSGLPGLEELWASAFMQHPAATQVENLTRVAPQLAAHPMAAPAGTAWRYNNFAYDLLACAIERASGRPFDAFVREAIFAPAGMRDAGFDQWRKDPRAGLEGSAVVEGLVPGYNGTEDAPFTAGPQMYASSGAGGMYATAADLARYDAALAAGRILSPAMRERAVREAYQVRSGWAYGYGWEIERDRDQRTVVHHSGGNSGYTTDYARYPDVGLTIVVLTNRGYADPEAVRASLAALLLSERTACAPAQVCSAGRRSPAVVVSGASAR